MTLDPESLSEEDRVFLSREEGTRALTGCRLSRAGKGTVPKLRLSEGVNRALIAPFEPEA